MTQTDTTQTQTADKQLTSAEVAALVTMAAKENTNIFTGQKKLKGAEIYAQMTKFGDLKPYTSEKMTGNYCNFRFGGAVIACPEEFMKAFDSHRVVEVTFTGRPYTREIADPNNAGQKKTETVQSYSMDGFVDLDSYKKAQLAQLKVVKIDQEIEMATKSIKGRDLAKEMTDAEIEALLAEA